MGVPYFYRWLVEKYPEAVAKAIEEKGEAVDTSLKKPNGLEFDNLYLDMNSIIHPCFHPDRHPPTTFEEVFNNIYEYMDRLFSLIRPRKLFYLAIDGVAPRAKMNQIRMGRFRTSKYNEIIEAEENRLRKEFEMAGKEVYLFENEESEISDSIILPGTVFMDKLSKAMKSYINQRIESDAGWKEIKVILSDANVPGEGEHKIMSFIRVQRSSPNYDPNTRHCLYGPDADLIMLALATHEVHFSILREDFFAQELQPECQSAPETSLSNADPSPLRCEGAFKPFRSPSSLIRKPYEFLHIWILREYLELDLKISNPPEKVNIDLDRLIDDFIFMCFFVGNDFLPNLPTLEVHEHAIDLLMHVYKEEFKNFGGYLVDMQWAEDKKARYVNLERVEKFILAVGSYEEKIFKKRSGIREHTLRRLLSQYSDQSGEEEEEEEEEEDQGPDVEVVHCASANGNAQTFKNVETETVENSESTNGTTNSTGYISEVEILQNTKELIKKLNSFVRESSDLFKSGSFAVDKVKLGAVGWKERYYKEKFSAEIKEDMESTRKAVVEKYTEGLCWMILYYFSGVPSWTWFYPFHYGIFASDFRGISQVKVNFQKGSPFKPFDQLVSVLPPSSARALPRAYQALMTSEESNIKDFYPPDFQVDEEGKRFLHQAICKLPFIDEERLLSETKKLEVELTDDESIRNETKVDVLFVRSSNKLGSQIFSLQRKQLVGRRTEMLKESIDTNLNPCDELLNTIIFAGSNWEDYKDVSQQNNVLCALYELPNNCQHIPRPLEGVHFPEKTISEAGIVERQLWHEYRRSTPNDRLRIQEFGRNETTEAKRSLTKSSFRVTYKGAGFGWSSAAGRGKQNNYTSDLFSHSESSTRFAFGHGERITFSSSSSVEQLRAPSSSWDSRPQNSHRGTYQGTFNLHDKRKSSSSGQVDTEGIEGLRISDSRQSLRSDGRAESVNTNFRPYRNSAVSDRNYEWRQSVQPSAATSYGRGFDRLPSHTWRDNQSPAANRDCEWRQSVQPPAATPHGRGFDRLPSHTWRHNQSPAAIRDYEWRQSLQPPASTPDGRGFDRLPSHTWRHNQSPAAIRDYEWRQSLQPPASTSEGQGFDRLPNHTWRHNQSPVANPPMPVHGRGLYMPNGSATNWHSRDTTKTSDTERYPRW